MMRYGGVLAPSKDERTTTIDDVVYVFSDNFKAALRNSCIDWAAFVNVYQDSMKYEDLFDEVTKVLNIKANEHLRGTLIPLVRKIYALPAQAHIACMMRQFMIFEPVTIALHSIFDVIKRHYEQLVALFVSLREAQLGPNSQSNDWEKLTAAWIEADSINDYDSSSTILLFINPPDTLDERVPRLHVDIAGDSGASKLRAAIDAFHYKGFCRLVPHKRLRALLEFPLAEFVAAIKQLDPSFSLPSYEIIESKVSKLLVAPNHPVSNVEVKRDTPPAALVEQASKSVANTDGRNSSGSEASAAQMELIMWYVNAIFAVRKQVYAEGRKLECHYENTAMMLSNVAIQLRQELVLHSPSGEQLGL